LRRKGCVVLQGDRVAVVTQGPWLGRDGFVAETAVQFDRVQASIARLERELEKSRQSLSEIAEEAGRARRLQSFEDSLKNERDNKLGNLQRGIHDLKVRLDAIEGEKSTYLGLTYRSFEAIDKKLTELSAAKALIERADKNVRRSTMLLAAVSVVALASLASHLFL
jgi:septal ring factor EnvC (AmiA/AmiB activator)